MNTSGWHPPCIVDNTDTLYLGDQHCQETVLVFFMSFYVMYVMQLLYWEYLNLL